MSSTDSDNYEDSDFKPMQNDNELNYISDSDTYISISGQECEAMDLLGGGGNIAFNGKVLWSIICGQSVLASDEVVGEELEAAVNHLQEGLMFYKNWSEEDHKSWCIKSKLKKEQQDFVCKVGKLLEVCSEQAWEIFQLFVQHEYKGSISQFRAAASNDREETALLHQVFSFYLTDPLHLLSCRRHILAADSMHPYEKLFKEFINKVLDPDHTLGTKLVSQLKSMSIRQSPQSRVISPHLPPNATQARISFQLSAIRHQLATLLVYHGRGKPCSPESICTLLQLAQGIGIGRDLLENVGTSEKSVFLNQLEAIDAFHSFLLALVINADSDPRMHPLCTTSWIDRINPLIHSLGSKQWHYPPILAWAVLQGRRESSEGTKGTDERKYSRLLQRAIKGNAFQYLQSMLKIAAFETDQLLLATGASITYSLICIFGTCFDIMKLGLMSQMHQLAKVCLAFKPTSHLFWNEEEGGASILLPSALEIFPHNPSALLDITTALALADEQSAAKVVDLMKELEGFTWPLMLLDSSSISASGNQCISRLDLTPLPGFTIPKETQGIILNTSNLIMVENTLLVCWQMPTNGWQVLLSSFQMLQNQIENGVIADNWSQSIVIGGLRLLSTILHSDLHHLALFEEHLMTIHKLFICVSQVLKPSDDLVSVLLEFFAEVAKSRHSDVLWSDLDGSPLLPSLPINSKGSDLLTNYRAGNIRALVCGIEAQTGNFSILRNLCSLAEESLKFHENGINSKSIRGIIVFVVKEVVPVMLLWRCSDASVRIAVIEGTFCLLHRALEIEGIDGELQDLIVNELTTVKRGVGSPLKSILESTSNLQVTFDQPAEWPHSSHAMKLTKLAKLALSLIHRIVGQYLHFGDRLSNFFLDGTSSSSFTSGSMSHGMWVPSKSPHLVLTIAYFVYHRMNPRLPYLALRTLTRLAKEMKVPLVACLGSEAEGLRDCLLVRLDSATEDLWVKVALLRLLTFSTLHQPGLTRLFLTPPHPLLNSVVTVLAQQKQSTSQAGGELLLALLELVASLWENNVTMATSYLREKQDFWESISFSLSHSTPGEVNNDVIGCIFKVFAFEYFGSNNQVCPNFKKNLSLFFDPKSDKFSSWIKYVFVTYIETHLDSSSDMFPWRKVKEESTNEVLENCIHFFVVILMRSSDLLNDSQKILVGVSVISSLLNLFEISNESSNYDALQILLADIHLSIVNNCGKVLSENDEYASYLVRVLSALRSSVLHTAVQCQVMVLAGILKAVSSVTSPSKIQDMRSNLVSAVVPLVEQHCALSSSFAKDDKSFAGPHGFSSPSSCLALASALLHLCMQPLSDARIEDLLESSHLVYALIQASVKHNEIGNSTVVREIHRLLSLIARRTSRTHDLNTQNLAISVSLVLSPHHQAYSSMLGDLLWCTIFCLRKEGASGLEGAIDIAAVHLSGITEALAMPDTKPDLALAAASLAATLAPFHQLWRVIHKDCFEQLLLATAGCIHRTTKLLHLKEALDREVRGNIQDESVSGDGASQATTLSQDTIALINQLLQILVTCLGVVQCLSPDLVDLLCCPGIHLTPFTFELIEPSIRRQTGNVLVLPNLATLADALHLYHTLVPKDVKHLTVKKPQSSGAQVDLTLLIHCTEKALYVFMTYCTILILCPNLSAREVRDIRTFLADETSSFFSYWTGRRSVSTPSTTPLPLGLKLAYLEYFQNCREILTSLCNLKNEI